MYLSDAETFCIYCSGIVIVTMCLCMIAATISFIISSFKKK